MEVACEDEIAEEFLWHLLRKKRNTFQARSDEESNRKHLVKVSGSENSYCGLRRGQFSLKWGCSKRLHRRYPPAKCIKRSLSIPGSFPLRKRISLEKIHSRNPHQQSFTSTRHPEKQGKSIVVKQIPLVQVPGPGGLRGPKESHPIAPFLPTRIQSPMAHRELRKVRFFAGKRSMPVRLAQ